MCLQIRMLVWKFKWWVMELKRWSTVIVYYCHWLPPIEGMLYAKHLAKYLHAQHVNLLIQSYKAGTIIILICRFKTRGLEGSYNLPKVSCYFNGKT